jgi:hypothetical protein
MLIPAAYIFLVLHVPGGREVTIELDEIVSMRESEGKNEHFVDKVHCMINTTDGKFISVIETCEQVREKIKEEVRKVGE